MDSGKEGRKQEWKEARISGGVEVKRQMKEGQGRKDEDVYWI